MEPPVAHIRTEHNHQVGGLDLNDDLRGQACSYELVEVLSPERMSAGTTGETRTMVPVLTQKAGLTHRSQVSIHEKDVSQCL